MIEAQVEAILIKTAALGVNQSYRSIDHFKFISFRIGLQPKQHLGKTLSEMRPTLLKLVCHHLYFNEFITFSLNFLFFPHWFRKRNSVSMYVVKVVNLNRWLLIVRCLNINALFCKILFDFSLQIDSFNRFLELLVIKSKQSLHRMIRLLPLVIWKWKVHTSKTNRHRDVQFDDEVYSHRSSS